MDSYLSEAESKEKHGVWNPMPELTMYSPYVHSRVDFNTFTTGIGSPYARVSLTYARVDFIPQSGSLDWALDCGLTNYTAKTQYRKFETNIPKKGTARLQSPNSYIHVSVSDLYISLIGLPILLQEKIGGPNVGIYV
jgi:hypothetical protein